MCILWGVYIKKKVNSSLLRLDIERGVYLYIVIVRTIEIESQ